jgi:membrane dipeptidase
MSAVFDLHCDTPYNIAKRKYNHIAPGELHKQHYRGAVFAHFVYPHAKYPFVDAVKLIASTAQYVNSSRHLRIAKHHREVKQDNVSIMLGVEGGHIFDRIFQQVEALYGLGVRVFTLTWNNSNRLAHSALDSDRKGLTKRGKEYMRKLKAYDVILDLSHASTRTVLDVCEIAGNAIIASHSCVRVLNPSFLRNIDDRAIRAISNVGGVVGVNFSKHHLGEHSVVDHIDYLCQNYRPGNFQSERISKIGKTAIDEGLQEIRHQ